MNRPQTEVEACYHGSDGAATTALYEKLQAAGPAGAVAVNLLRACKNSERAKGYKSRRSVGAAYGSKDWALGQLIGALMAHAEGLGVAWGWGLDPKTGGYEHVLYVEVPGSGQVSFHMSYRGAGPDYGKPWDGVKGVAAGRIIRYAHQVLGIEVEQQEESHGPRQGRGEGAAAADAGEGEAGAAEQPGERAAPAADQQTFDF